MRLVSYHTRDHEGVGVMVDDLRFVSLRRAAPDLPSSLKAILELGPAALKWSRRRRKGAIPISASTR